MWGDPGGWVYGWAWERVAVDGVWGKAGMRVSFPVIAMTGCSWYHLAMQERKRYPENAPGPFYVEEDLCILCGAPEAVSPNLVGMTERHCYFKKQPESPEELEQAIKAVDVSCWGAYRYSGHNPKVIGRLDSTACDNAKRPSLGQKALKRLVRWRRD
jgi:hypothetical protein